MSLYFSPTYTEEDVATMVKWLNDKNLMRYSEQRHKEHTVEGQCNYISTFKYPDFFLSIRKHSLLIGSITAYVDKPNSVANLGLLIGWPGHGYGTEAWGMLLNGLRTNRIRKVEAGCMSDNIGMMRVCEKSGMLIEGWQNKHFILDDGSYSHLVHWGLFL